MKAPGAQRVGVLLVAHGTIRHTDELPEFVNVIRRGLPPPDGLLQELRERYTHIGGSPLLEITEAQARLLGEALELPTYVAMRLWHPLLSEVLPRIVDVDTLCVVPLAPFSVHVYRAAVEHALEGLPRAPTALYAEPWGTEPSLVAAHARAIRELFEGPEDVVILTAHSLPLAAIRAGDPYVVQFEASARAVERALGRKCHLAYQSQGVGGGAWLGPSVEELLIERAEQGARRVILAPVGFLADHVETLYDLDVAASEQARCLGLDFARVPALNTDPGLIEAMAALVRRTLHAKDTAGAPQR